MNYYHLAKPLRRLLALALLGLALTGIAALTVFPFYARLADLQETIDQERATLGRFEAIERDQQEARDLDRRATAARANGMFLDGESESIRVANLQSLLAEILATNGNEFRLLGVQLQFVAPIEVLRKILVVIEEQPRLLIVDAIQVMPLIGTWAGSEELRGTLDIRFDIFGVEPRQK
jgi:hypothetical protein